MRCQGTLHSPALHIPLTHIFQLPIRLAPKPPWWIPNLTSHIATTKEEATEQFSNLPGCPATQHLYSDGSKTEHGIGAGVIDPQCSCQLSLCLGDASQATVFEAELAGIQLALQLAATLPTTVTQVTIHLDNQHAILACMGRPTTQPAQHHILMIHSTLHTLQSSHPQTRFHLNWIPSHTGITGNEATDKIAKVAANNAAIDAATPPPFPASATVARKHARAHFTRLPKNQRHANHHRKMRGSTSSHHTVCLLSGMKRRQCSIMVQLQSGHVGLHSYLACFAHVDTPICERCATPETVEHYLTACKCHTLVQSELICSIMCHTNNEIKDKSKDVAMLLSHPDAIPITLQYIAATGRFPLHAPNTLTQAVQATHPFS
jgi:ribonuclease HI